MMQAPIIAAQSRCPQMRATLTGPVHSIAVSQGWHACALSNLTCSQACSWGPSHLPNMRLRSMCVQISWATVEDTTQMHHTQGAKRVSKNSDRPELAVRRWPADAGRVS